MRAHTTLLIITAFFSAECAAEKATYLDPALPIFENEDLNCHHLTKAEISLYLASYQNIKQGAPKLSQRNTSMASPPEDQLPMPKHAQVQPAVVTERPTTAHSPWTRIATLAGQKQISAYHRDDFGRPGISPHQDRFRKLLIIKILQTGREHGAKVDIITATTTEPASATEQTEVITAVSKPLPSESPQENQTNVEPLLELVESTAHQTPASVTNPTDATENAPLIIKNHSRVGPVNC